MTVARLGELSFSDVCPLLALMHAQLQVAIGAGMPDIQAKLEGLAGVLAAITVAPPAIGATITAALELVAELQATISGPTVTLEASAILSLIAELNVTLGALTAAAALSIPSGSLSAYVFSGQTGNFGTEVQGALNASLPGAPSSQTYALVLATTAAEAWASASLVFRTS